LYNINSDEMALIMNANSACLLNSCIVLS